MDVFESIWRSFGARFCTFQTYLGCRIWSEIALGVSGGVSGGTRGALGASLGGFRGFPGGSQGPFWAHVGDFGIPNGMQKCIKTVTKTRSGFLHALGVLLVRCGCPATLKMLLLCGRVCTDSLSAFSMLDVFWANLGYQNEAILEHFGDRNDVQKASDFKTCSGSALEAILEAPLWNQAFQGGAQI